MNSRLTFAHPLTSSTHQHVVPRLQRVAGRLLEGIQLERVVPCGRPLVLLRRQQ